MANPWPVLATGAVVTGLGMAAGALHGWRVRRLIQDTPTAKIRSMPMGRVEIEGTVTARSGTRAALSGRECAYWELDVSVQSGKRGWTIVQREQSGSPFYLEDGTGVALIYPRGAECRVTHALEEACHGLSLPPVYADYLAGRDLKLRHVWRLGAMRFRERMLLEGSHVYVLGAAFPRARSVAVSDGEAMEATGTDGLRAVRVRSLDAEVCGVIRGGPQEGVFLISQHSERHLSAELGAQTALGLLGGPVLFLLGLAYWLRSLQAGRLLD